MSEHLYREGKRLTISGKVGFIFLLPNLLPKAENKKDASMSAVGNYLIFLEKNGARSRT